MTMRSRILTNSSNRHRKVLIIDDEDLVLSGLTALLEAWGMDVLAASSGEMAMRKLKELPTGRPPDAMIVDYRLQAGENGLQVIDTIRHHLNREVPVLMVSGDTALDLLHQVRLSGCTMLHKPIAPDVLHYTLKAVMV